ncbi:LexA family protein [Pseudomonas putida]|uniref:S24 family peptidase n=1 Tax=Pseudomonas fortuita TaxID=3233375 RepID=A0ACD4P185_9PSED|nr:S24 family peptidase [Pseudomonas putida]ANI04188.1 repressor [Pseudomonas putida SJTE-1]MCS4063681.1 SOS-response transcriptional repressor LexA [Pseudomonas putida]MDD2005178.1 helix-turn-helix domain-containing protein [Pseudomonas putida]MDD2018141.1 helix-turn-helix domain-containing protein [Pseudomonas putida]WAP61851.1 S24 family peptidase [Pseudomonas putida]
MNRPERIAKAIKHSKKLKKEIARECGVTPSAVTQWITGDSKSMRPENLFALAQATGVSAEWLANGTGEMIAATSGFDANVEPASGPFRYYEYPEISWVQAGMPVEAVEISNVASCEVHPSDAWAGPNGFWLKVKGPSMTSPNGMSFPEGMVILVAPGFDVESSQFVVAKMTDTNEATFKQFIWDSGRAFLKPLNPSFPTVEMDGEWVLVGRVVDAKWPRSAL